jgi:hypothetical protein
MSREFERPAACRHSEAANDLDVFGRQAEAPKLVIAHELEPTQYPLLARIVVGFNEPTDQR